jgi:HK97 family phage major capsid protein
MAISDLQDRRTGVIQQATLIAQAGVTARRDLTNDEANRFDKLMAEANDLEGRIRNLHAGEQRSQDLQDAYRPTGGSYDREESRLSQWARGAKLGDEYELEAVPGAANRAISAFGEKRAMSMSGAAPDGAYGTLWEYAVASSELLQCGVDIINTRDGNTLPMPRVTVHATGASAAANAALTASDATINTVDLSVVKDGYLTLVPAELVQDASFDLESYLARAAGRELGRIIASVATTALIAGFTVTGATGPTGVSGALGNQASGGQGTDLLVDLFHSVLPEYRSQSSWLMNDSFAAVLRKLKSSTGDPVWQESLISDQPPRIFGKAVYLNPFTAGPATSAKSIYFGDFSALKVRIAGGIRFERSVDYAFGTDQVAFRAVVRTGSVVVDPNAVKFFIGAST